MDLCDVATPAFVIDRPTVERNLARMHARAAELGVELRAHQKTAKCVEIARRAVGDGGPITVSTAREVAYFLEHGFRDVTWAVGATPDRLNALRSLVTDDTSIGVVLDAPETARRVAESWSGAPSLRVYAEIDCGGRRGGIAPDDGALISLAETIEGASTLTFAGVLTHGGHSYHRADDAAIRRAAEEERAAAVHAATRVRKAGVGCETVSVGSTPTAVFAKSLDGVTEIRPGVYALFDLYQEALGVCARGDIAGTVLASVIGHTADGQALIDAGSLALSLDRGPIGLGRDTGLGLVVGVDGAARVDEEWVVERAHQEHGFVGARGGASLRTILPMGARVRVLPNHACMTAAPYTSYVVVEGERVVDTWGSISGW